MYRLLFEKKGRAVWISHLDLMRLFQRAFKRAGLLLTHTQGYNPRPSVSIALPLSVGTESCCELMDFDLEQSRAPAEIMTALNSSLTEGIRVLSVYTDGMKIRQLAYLQCSVSLLYDKLISEPDAQKIRELFERETLTVEKKTKNGVKEQDILPMIINMEVICADDHTIVLQAKICCQNPSLNPNQIVSAVSEYLPELQPDCVRIERCEIFDLNHQVFR